MTKKIAVASGKGGTGKTSVALSLAYVASKKESVTIIDTDVEGPNVGLFLSTEITKKEDTDVMIPKIDLTKCTFCGKCAEACKFNSLAVTDNDVMVFNEMCHSCEGCILACPEDAIDRDSMSLGYVQKGHTDWCDFADGHLKTGAVRAPPIIEHAKEIAKENEIMIYDASPGSSCNSIETITGSDFVILVTEPTPFGAHDLKLAIEMTQVFDIKFGVVINRDGIYGSTSIIDDLCKKFSTDILMRIPYDRKYAEAYSVGKFLAQVDDQMEQGFEKLYEEILRRIES